MKKGKNLTNTFTITVKDTNGKELNSIIKKGSVEERKKIYLSFEDDTVDYFTIAEQYIKNNYVDGDNLFADDEALFGASIRIAEMVRFDAATLVATPEGMNAHFSIEGTDADGNKLIAHFSKPSVQVKKKLFNLVTRGANKFALGEIVLLECMMDGDDLSQDAEVFASASMIAAAHVEFNEAFIKKN